MMGRGRPGTANDRVRGSARILTIALLGLSVFAAPAQSQTIVGRVLDESHNRPIVGADVALLDRDGKERARSITDQAGRFVITPPEAGEYELAALRLGYRPARTPLLSLGTEGTAELDLLMQPAPIGLEGLDVSVDVSVEAAADLEQAGVTPRDLGTRWIDRADVEAVPVKRDLGSVLERQQIGGLRVARPENTLASGDPVGLCISMQRARTGSGMGRCMMGVVNGIPQSNDALLGLDPETIEAMAVLTPTEGSFLYGARGEAGVVMIWTRRR